MKNIGHCLFFNIYHINFFSSKDASGLLAAADALSTSDEYGNDSRVEALWAMKAIEHAEVYFNVSANSNRPAHGLNRREVSVNILAVLNMQENSSLYWLVLYFFNALFVQWSILQTIEKNISFIYLFIY